jgi:uncharacterized protein (DUF736 family)
MIIGNFKKTSKGFEGIIETLLFTAQAIIEPVSKKATRNSPDFRLLTSEGRRIGVAWEKTSQSSGKKYLSVIIEDPSASINCALFKTEAGDYVLTWQKPRPEGQHQTDQEVMDDDEIPF